MSLTNGKSHFHASVKCNYKAYGNERKVEAERRKAARETVRLAGYQDSRYFQYKNGDDKRKAEQKANAEKYAAQVQAATGVEMEVSEGFFLNLW
jgi:hypothetical protein